MNIRLLTAMMLFLVFVIPCGALEASAIVSDDFSAPALDTGLWTVVNPLGDAGLTPTGTNIEITVPSGTAHSPWTGGNLAPRIMQSVSNGDFEIEVRFDAKMNKAFMMQGIVIEQDANHFLRFEFFSDGTNTRIFAAALAGNSLPLTSAVKKNAVIGDASSPVPLYMRVKREGDQWTQSYSTDGTVWTQSVSFTYAMNVTSAGPYAGNDGTDAPGFTGSIDYFFNTAAPIIPGDGGDSTAPLTAVWYGNSQVFGQLGVPQAWVNILGNVSDPSGISSLSYSVNGGADIPLSVGPDGLRLESEGDFNIEIANAELACSPELNEVAIKATDFFLNTGVETVTVEYICGTTWPEPYSIDWSTVTGISDAAQVVDGRWTLATDSIRPAVTGYDRIVAIGDMTWDDYEVSVPVTIHSMGPDGIVSLGMRWQGHSDQNGGQPRSAWWPVGAIGGYGWFNDVSDYRMRIIGNDVATIADDATGLHLTEGVSYIFKMRAETFGSNSIYSLKVWESGTTEPSGWNLRGMGLSGELKQGSATLVANNTDASFGEVTITPGPFSDDTTPPAIGSIMETPDAFSATVSWTTDEPSTGQVEYGLTQAYEMGSVLSGSLGSSHSVSLVGLAPETVYHIRVVSVDPYGNSGNSSDATFVSTAAQSSIVSDDFNSCALAGLWGFADPVGDVAFTMIGTNAKLAIPAGTSHELWTAANLAPRIMQPANDRDFEVEVKFDSNLDVQNATQGILVEQDSNNYLRFDFFGSGSSLRVFAATASNGTAVTRSNKVIGTIPAPAPFYMRIKREGSRWTQTYSFDGQTWNTAAVFKHKLTVNSVGPFAGNAVDNPAFTSSIDYFFNTASPIAAEDGNPMQVTVNITGEGTVTKNPDKPSYSCGDVVELTPYPAADWSFDSWTGDCSGTGVCSVTIDGPKTANATFTVNKSEQTITFAFIEDKIYGTAPFTASATGGGSGNPVTFAIVSGPATATGTNGSTITLTGAGTVTVRASQEGNAYYNAAADVDRTFTVNKANQTISFDAITDKTYGAAPFTASATGGGSGNPVTFAIVSGPATATGTNGSTITLTGAGTVTVRASQEGNAYYNAAADVDSTFTVSKANQKITVTKSAPVKAALNSSFIVSATVKSGLEVAITTSGVCTGSGSTSATITMTADSGTCLVSYNQSGNSDYNAAPEKVQMTNAKPAVPSAPVSLSVTVLSETSVSLTWTDTSDNETGFKIEQKAEGGEYSNIAFAAADAGSRTLYGLTPGTTYTYRVRAYNGGGNSGYSNEAAAALTKPDAPTELRARAISASEVVVAWQDNSVLETRFILQRKTGDCTSANPWEAAGRLPADTEEYTNTGLQANTVYSYRIKASNSYGQSVYSGCAASVLTGKEGTPASPTNLKVEAADASSVHLSWDDNSSNEKVFKIFRRVVPGSSKWVLYSTTEAGITEFIDASADGNSTSSAYFYYVKACNSSGCSPFSAVAEVPNAPAALSAVPGDAGGISITWPAADDNPSGYIVYRKTGGCESADLWEELAILPEEATSYNDDSVASGTPYSYLHIAFLMSDYHPVAYGYSLESPCVSVMAP